MTALNGLFILLALWVLVRGFRAYALDAHRERLFELRDELFELGRTNKVSFSDPEYRRLWDGLNGRIRYAHMITSARILPVLMAQRLQLPVAGLEALDAPAEAAPTHPDLKRLLERAGLSHLGFSFVNATLATSLIIVGVLFTMRSAAAGHEPRELRHREFEARLLRVEPKITRAAEASEHDERRLVAVG